MKKIVALAAAGLMLAGCSSQADTASYNVSKDADQFKIDRRIVFFNGITDKYMLTIEGRCSINVDSNDGQLEVICKTGETQFKKHFLGLSDNVTYFVEQMESADVSVYRYKVLFRPSTIIPDVETDVG